MHGPARRPEPRLPDRPRRPGADRAARAPRAGQAGGPFKDGGLADRTGLVAWRRRREAQARARAGAAAAAAGVPGPPAALVHLIARSSRFSGADDVAATGARSQLAACSQPSATAHQLRPGR